MPLLTFCVGPVACGKTVDLIIKANQLQSIEGEERTLVLKPSVDTRFSADVVKSATGLQIKSTHLICPIDNLLDLNLSNVSHIFVDEIQFFTVQQIEQLRQVATEYNIDVHCYGLLSDFKLNIFEASKRLLELCDDFKLFKTYCLMCRTLRKEAHPNYATHNLKIKKFEDRMEFVVEGDSVCIGGIDTFLPVCFECFHKATNPLKK